MKKSIAIVSLTVVCLAGLAIIAYALVPGKPGPDAPREGAADRDSFVLAAAGKASLGGTQAPAMFPNKPDSLKLLSLDEALSEAKATGKYVLIYFWTSWCPNCEIFNRQVLPDPAVLESLNRSYVFVSIDGDNDRDMLGRVFRVRGYPTLYILDHNSEPALVIPGRIPADTFAHVLNYISTGAHEKMGFEEYEATLS
ncbi:MAG: thioredoxin fold domain-containing protein [Deltaproteobacteria bacterium]|jgi:thioredoxin-related protein|nr:thioredoxin fold domain-containing protein [Deltaproteobacteria bacterium]